MIGNGTRGLKSLGESVIESYEWKIGGESSPNLATTTRKGCDDCIEEA